MDHLPLGRVVQRHDGNVFDVDVIPDVQLRPVAQREHAERFARIVTRVEHVPQFRPLVLGVPLHGFVAKGEDPFLRPRPFFIAPGPAEGRIELMLPKRRHQGLGLQQLRTHRAGPVFHAADALQRFGVGADDQLEVVLAGHPVAKLDHLAELEGGVHVHQRERKLVRIERLLGQPEHDRRVLADRVEHHGVLELRNHLSEDMDALGLQLLQMCQVIAGHEPPSLASSIPRCFRSVTIASAHWATVWVAVSSTKSGSAGAS